MTVTSSARATRLGRLSTASAAVRVCVAAFGLIAVAHGVSQAPGTVTGNNRIPVNPLANRYTDGVSLFDDSAKAKLDPKQVEAANRLRLETMQSETDKVLLLARHLHAEVAKDNPEATRAREIAEAAQVEHLAQVVQKLMKASAGN